MTIKPTTHPLTVLVLACALVGCSLNAEPLPAVTPSPAPTEALAAQAIPTDQPTATLAPTVTPPPTAIPLPPSEALGQAWKAAHDGYHDEARRLYDQIVAAPDATPDQVLAAAAGSAEVALRDGLFEAARNTLNTALERYPDQPGAASAYFLRGEANLGLSRWTAAINDYRQYLALRPGVIDSYVHERIADAFLALDMRADALASYDQATGAGRALTPWLALRERAAQVYLSLGEPMRAVAEYDAILASAQNRLYQSDIALRAAEAARAAGDAGAPLRYRNVFETYIDTPAALTALGVLGELGVAVSDYDRGRAYFYAEDFAGAIEAFNDHTTSVVLMDIPAELHLFLGQAYRAVGNPTAAQVAFRTIVEQYPTSPLFGDALLEQGRTQFQSGDTAEAINTYLNIADTHSNLPTTAAEALWRAGFLYSELGNTDETLQVFERLNQLYPTSAQAASGAPIAAAAAMAAGNTAQAEQWYNRTAALSSGETAANAYWQAGRLAAQRGAADAAQTAFAAAVNANPDGYVAARIREQAVNVRPFSVFTAAPTPDDRAEAEAWVRTTFNLPPETPLGALPENVLADPTWRRGAELWALGQFAAAETEFVASMGVFASDGAALYGMALALRDLGAYYPSQQAAANLITAGGAATLTAPGFIARLRFPTPYPDLIAAAVEPYQLDPFLLYSLMRAESLFDTYATAAAGEKGMTQVIPSTAEYIAGQLAWPDYQHELLFRPHVGIAFGAFYLGEQMAMFENNPAVALSAYNAGPGRGIAWRDASNGGTDFDAFLNAITISSTRGYVERIYTFHATYRALYAGPGV